VSEYYKLDSGLLIPEGEAVRRKLSGTRPKCVDLFAGCGGFSLGMIQAGWEVLAGLDFDADAAHTYMTNLGTYPCRFHFGMKADQDRMEKCLAKSFKRKGDQIGIFETAGSGYLSTHPDWPGVPHFFMGDVRKFRGEDILEAIGVEYGELDAVVGSPPCQGFSRAGKRNVMDPRNSLMFEFARLVCEMKPKTLVLENVPDITSMVTPEGIPVLDMFTRVLEDGDFAGVDAVKATLKAQLGITVMRSKKPAETAKPRRRRRKAA
jgi:DNA (cytosine-5)-methyltransferase 1